MGLGWHPFFMKWKIIHSCLKPPTSIYIYMTIYVCVYRFLCNINQRTCVLPILKPLGWCKEIFTRNHGFLLFPTATNCRLSIAICVPVVQSNPQKTGKLDNQWEELETFRYSNQQKGIKMYHFRDLHAVARLSSYNWRTLNLISMIYFMIYTVYTHLRAGVMALWLYNCSFSRQTARTIATETVDAAECLAVCWLNQKLYINIIIII